MINLFIYGTLRDNTVVRAVTGKVFRRNKAVLSGYQSFEQQSGFPYIHKVKRGRINGFILWDVDDDALSKIDRYEDEGIIYSRIEVKVSTGGKKVPACTYVGNIDNIRRHFGDQIDSTITTRVEEYLEKQIGEHIPLDRRGLKEDDIDFQAQKEFFDNDIQHLLNLYFANTYVSPNRIDEDLSIKNIPTLAPLREKDEVRPYAAAYLSLACRFMVFNRLADLIHMHNRPALFTKDPFCMYSLTNLVTLRLLNNHQDELEYFLSRSCPADGLDRMEYTDYARGAASLCNQFFRQYATEIDFLIKEIPLTRQTGRVPLGAELEFSNIGRHAAYSCRPHDRQFNNFKHFHDFDLLRRCWRLGGHLDDHVVSNQSQKKNGGFLEFALGKNNLLQYTSKPVSTDIHMLARLIREVTAFVPVRPHSLHINVENVLGDIDWERPNDPELMKCLVLLSGDFGMVDNGCIFEKRIGNREIVDPWGNIEIMVENRQFPNSPDIKEEMKNTVEFQFPRLQRGRSYTPVLMGIKGFYLGYNPRPYSSKLQIVDQQHIRDEGDVLIAWARDVKPISEDTITTFLSQVETGLFTGLHDMSLKHRKNFLKKEMFLIEKEVRTRNEWIRETGRRDN